MKAFRRLSNKSKSPSQPEADIATFLHRRPVPVMVQEEETLIAVVGVTGSGKSSFIKRVTGRDDIEIGEGLCSQTQGVTEYQCSVGGKNFKLIDTPGFDDTEVDDEDIFEALVDWLEKSYRKGQRLTGLLYLHRIISNREKGSDLRNLRVFQKLCGDKSFSNVIIGITWWDQEEKEVADSREKVLRESDEFWGHMVKQGAEVVRVPLEQQGCVDLLMNLSGRQKTTLDVQNEVVNQGKTAKQTAAATALVNYDMTKAAKDSDMLDHMAMELRVKAQRLRQEYEAARLLAEQRAKYEEEDERLLAEAEALLEKKKREADEFRQRTEARRRRMEEIQRQLREAEEHTTTAQQDSLRLENFSPTTDDPPPSYDISSNLQARSIQSRSPSSNQTVEYDRVRPVPRTDADIAERERRRQELAEQQKREEEERQRIQILEEDRRARVLAEQMAQVRREKAEAQKKEQDKKEKEQERLLNVEVERKERERQQKLEAERKQREQQQKLEAERKAKEQQQKLEAEKQERDRLEKEQQEEEAVVAFFEQLKEAVDRARSKREEEEAIAAYQQQLAAYQDQLTEAFSALLLASLNQSESQWETQETAASREIVQRRARTERHIESIQASMRWFANFQQTSLAWLRQHWRGVRYGSGYQALDGPLQTGFCGICMAALPTGEGHWQCNRCTLPEGMVTAVCNDCKVSRQQSRQAICFNIDHTLQFTRTSDVYQFGNFNTCNRLRKPFRTDSLICSRCHDPLDILFFHCCICDRDDFDLCMKCWGQLYQSCGSRNHTLYLHSWVPPCERSLEN